MNHRCKDIDCWYILKGYYVRYTFPRMVQTYVRYTRPPARSLELLISNVDSWGTAPSAPFAIPAASALIAF